MLVDCGEDDATELKGLMTPEFATTLEEFRRAQDREFAPFRSAEDLKALGLAIGEYLVSAGMGSTGDKEDFVDQTAKLFAKWPVSIVMQAMRSAAAECEWPRELAGWMSDIVNSKLQAATKQRDNAETLLKIWRG